jgi:hypothetical protein
MCHRQNFNTLVFDMGADDNQGGGLAAQRRMTFLLR